MAIVEAKLASYTGGDLAADVELLKGLTPGRKQTAVKLRICEKKMLTDLKIQLLQDAAATPIALPGEEDMGDISGEEEDEEQKVSHAAQKRAAEADIPAPKPAKKKAKSSKKAPPAKQIAVVGVKGGGKGGGKGTGPRKQANQPAML